MYNMLESRLQLTEAVEMYLRGTEAQSYSCRMPSIFLGTLFKQKFLLLAVKCVFHSLWVLGIGSASPLP